MKHWTRLGWTNVNAIEVQEFGGILPCVREEEGLMEFSRQRKSLEKGWPARPPRGKNRNISIYDQITMCLLTAVVFHKMNSCKGYICWASLPGLPIESDGFLALERKSHIGKSLTHWPCGKNAIMLMLMRMMIMRRVYDTCQSSLHPPRPCYRCTLLTFPRQPKVEGRFFWRYFPDLFLLILNLFWVNPNDMKWKW